MSLADAIRNLLGEPELRGLDPDSVEFTEAHRRILRRKKLARRIYEDFCRRCRAADERYFAGCRSSVRVEIGSGVGVMKETYADVITSDVKPLPHLDVVLRGEELPFFDASLRAIYA